VEGVAAFAAGELHLARKFGELVVGVEGAGDEGLFEPHGMDAPQRLQPRRGGGHVFNPDCSRVHQKHRVVAESLPRGEKLFDVVGDGAFAEGAPTELGGAVAVAGDLSGPVVGLLGAVAEKLGGVRGLGIGAVVAEQLVHRDLALAGEQVPQGDVNAGERVVGLQQVEAVVADEVADPADVVGTLERLAED
jgi:hypothetical protein